MKAEELENASEQELLSRANQCLERAGSGLDTPATHFDDAVRLRLLFEAQFYLTAAARKRAEEAAELDRRREHHRFLVELIVEFMIIVLIGWEIYEGRQQAEILEQMKTSTANTASAMEAASTSLKILAEKQTTSLQIFQKEQADRLAQLAKKPELTLYVGHVPLAKTHGPLKPNQESDTAVTFDFVLRNVGDATANKVTFRTLLPPDVTLTSWPNYTPASDLHDRPVHAFLYYMDSLRSKNYIAISVTFIFPKGHPPFQVTFNADSEEIRTDTPLGTLMISPRMPLS